MYKDTTDHGYFIILDLVPGSAKFRKDDDWAVNWGSADFPSGIGTQDGDNIPIAQAGTYHITLDTMTGAYNFTEIITFTTIGIIGDATPGGWDEDTDLTQDANNPDLWMVDIDLVDGSAKFRAENDWAINWGGTDFPTGIGVQDGGDIPVVAGRYRVSLNTATGEYNFAEIVAYTTIGIIGDATPGGWDADTDMTQDMTNTDVWKLRVTLTDGEAKFRAEDDWAVNWGSGDFPIGVGIQDGANIPVVAGEYNVTFNTFTGDYEFVEIIVFNTVGIVGPAGPSASWDIDFDMIKNAGNENLWELPSVIMTDGEAKFRAEDDWAVNWGADTWPSGVGTQDGPNIPITGGTYSVSLNSASGEYMFADPVGTKEHILDPSSVIVFPNPTSDWLNIDVQNINLKGKVNIRVVDLQGKNLFTTKMDASAIMQINVANLPTGNYLLQMNNENYIIGKKFSVIK